MAEHYGQNLRAEEVQQRHEEDRHRAEQRDELLARVGLSDKADAYPKSLSGGQQ